jgi:hypothetical protein
MPQVVAAAIVYVVGAELGITVATVLVSVFVARDQQRKAENRAKDAYNASLRDRYVMTRGATEPRQIVMGRQRVSGTMSYIGSYGTNKEHLVFTLALAAHEIDAVEAIYFDDEQVILDGAGGVNGNVVSVRRRDRFTIAATSAAYLLSSTPKAGSVTASARYGTNVVTLTVTNVTGTSVSVSGGLSGQTGEITISYQPDPSPFAPGKILDSGTSFTLNGSGNGSITLPRTPITGSVHVSWSNGQVDSTTEDLTPYTSVAGAVVTVTGSPFTGTVRVTYQYADNTAQARIRTYLGAAGQTADAGMIASLPGVWTANHKGVNTAYLVVELDYGQDAFPNSLPNVSAVVRGAKCQDPRIGLTVWTENPAILMRWYATHSLGGRQNPSAVDDATIIAAANVCDESVSYFVNNQTYTRAKFKAGLVAKSGVRPADVLNDLADAMCGKWTHVNGKLRVKGGSFVTPLQTLDEAWLRDGPVRIQPRSNRSDVYNVASGRFADEQSDYQVLPFPRVTAAAYVTEDGIELPHDIVLNAVTFTGQAQQVVATMMRDARQGLRVVLQCNMRALAVEVFDNLYVTIARYGWVNKVFEVLQTSFTLDGGIELVLKETDATIWAMGSSFPATDPAANTLLPSPFQVQRMLSLNVTSGNGVAFVNADGTVMPRMKATWVAATDPGVLETTGGIEIKYGPATQDENQWTTIKIAGTNVEAYLQNVQFDAIYLVKIRGYNSLARGPWSLPVLHKVLRKTTPPANVAGLGYIVVQGGVQLSWTPNTAPDVQNLIELRVGGTGFGNATRLFRGNATTWTWPFPALGSYTVRAKHFDTSGNESGTEAVVAVTVDANVQAQWGSIAGRPKRFRAIARGFNDTAAPAGADLYNGETGASIFSGGGFTVSRSYMMASIRRADGALTFARQYDVYGVGAAGGFTAATLAADLNATGPDSIVVVFTFDEPQRNRGTSGMDTAMYRCGASRAVFGSPDFKARSAYILVGIGGCGEGNGYEAYQGAFDNDANAWCDVAFDLLNGNMIVSGSAATPKTLRDYSYTGDLNASSDIALVAGGAGALQLAGNSLVKLSADGWTADVHSAEGITGACFASFTVGSFPMDAMVGLNSDPTTDADWPSLDYAAYVRGDGAFDVRESGGGTPALGSYALGDTFLVTYDGASVKYHKNGTVFRTVAAPAGLKLYLDSSIYTQSARISNLRFGPMSPVTNIGTGQLQDQSVSRKVVVTGFMGASTIL